jgi:hypothetical protein
LVAIRFRKPCFLFRLINDGFCQRHHDLAQVDTGGAKTGISMLSVDTAPFRAAVSANNQRYAESLGGRAVELYRSTLS